MTEEQIREAALNYATTHKLKESGETNMLSIMRIFLAGAHYAIKQLNKK